MIVCGSGPTAMYAASELASVRRPVVLVASSATDTAEAKSDLRSVPVVLGDPTDDEVLRAAGIERARGVIACAESDNHGVVITLTARQLNPNVRIVARLQDVDRESKIRKVGADAVVSPQHIGGLRRAGQASWPAPDPNGTAPLPTITRRPEQTGRCPEEILDVVLRESHLP